MATPHASTTLLDEDQTIAEALRILQQRMRYDAVTLSRPTAVRQFLPCWFAEEEREVFCALWLDTQNRLIQAENLFFGTLTQTAVYPREVVKRALQLNAAAVIFAHNHPGGTTEPSPADAAVTRRLQDALALMDVRMLDHLVVAGQETRSCAELGIL